MKRWIKILLFSLLFIALGFIFIYFAFGCSSVNFRAESYDLLLNSIFYSSSSEDFVSFGEDLSDTVIKNDGVFYLPNEYSYSAGVIQFYTDEEKLDFVLSDEDTLFSSTFKKYFYREVI